MSNAGCSFVGVQSSDDASTLVEVPSFAGEESRMPIVEVITALCAEVAEQLRAILTHPEAHPWPSEVSPWG